MQRALQQFGRVPIISLLLTTMVLFSSSATAYVPGALNYQGYLTDSSGHPMDTTVNMTFTIYDDSLAGTTQWAETLLVEVKAGLCQVPLGSVRGIQSTVLSGASRWLGIAMGSDPEVAPRTRLLAVPYALQSLRADTASSGGGWIDDGSVVRLATPSDTVAIGTDTPKGKYQISDCLLFGGGNYPYMGFNWTWWDGANRRAYDGGAARMMMYKSDGTLVFQSKPFGSAGDPLTDGAAMFIKNWNVGIGIGDPKYRLHVKTGTIGIETDAVPLLFRESDRTGAGSLWRMPLDARHLRFDVSNDGVGFDSYTTVLDLKPSGTVTVPVLQITGGSDLSEQFDVAKTESTEVPEPGMLVCIDRAVPGGLTVSKRAYDATVAGVISGAGGITPGMLMGQQGTLADGQYPVALTGRVYCLADATYGAIAPGDLLTTSDTPGHAMKVTDRERGIGAVIGKAMSDLHTGRDLILVLVGLH